MDYTDCAVAIQFSPPIGLLTAAWLPRLRASGAGQDAAHKGDAMLQCVLLWAVMTKTAGPAGRREVWPRRRLSAFQVRSTDHGRDD
jgi:hypothetical protein